MVRREKPIKSLHGQIFDSTHTAASTSFRGNPVGTLRIATSYQWISFRSRKNLPEISGGASVANQTAVSAPSSTDLDALGPPISVRTQPGHIELTVIPSLRSF